MLADPFTDYLNYVYLLLSLPAFVVQNLNLYAELYASKIKIAIWEGRSEAPVLEYCTRTKIRLFSVIRRREAIGKSFFLQLSLPN